MQQTAKAKRELGPAAEFPLPRLLLASEGHWIQPKLIFFSFWNFHTNAEETLKPTPCNLVRCNIILLCRTILSRKQAQEINTRPHKTAHQTWNIELQQTQCGSRVQWCHQCWPTRKTSSSRCAHPIMFFYSFISFFFSITSVCISNVFRH